MSVHDPAMSVSVRTSLVLVRPDPLVAGAKSAALFGRRHERFNPEGPTGGATPGSPQLRATEGGVVLGSAAWETVAQPNANKGAFDGTAGQAKWKRKYIDNSRKGPAHRVFGAAVARSAPPCLCPRALPPCRAGRTGENPPHSCRCNAVPSWAEHVTVLVVLGA